MTPFQRSRRLQAGLAGLGIVGALGASVGIGAATHTASGTPASGSGTASSGPRQHTTTRSGSSNDSEGGSDDSGSSSSGTTHQQARSSTPKVSQPSPAPPQATTSGS